MDCCDAPEPSALVIQKTMAAVNSAAKTRMLLDREAAAPAGTLRPTFTLKELGALAALLFIGVALLLPAVNRARLMGQDNACQAQAGQIGVGLAKYATEHNGNLPAIAAGQASWMIDGQAPTTISNSRNLWMLIQGRYVPLHVFQCPEQGALQQAPEGPQTAALVNFPSTRFIDYSYQYAVNSRPLQITGESLPAGAAGSMVILADSNPVFADGRFDPARLSNVDKQISPNHGGRNQSVLYLDLHSTIASRADVGVNHDNIWTAEGVSTYHGTEGPAQATDSFLLPSFVETH